MFKAVSTSNESRNFDSYAAAYRFSMEQAAKSRLWEIVASCASAVAAARAEKNKFHRNIRKVAM